jgi:hypothetical protein
MKKVFTAIILLGLASGISGCQTVSKMSKLWHKDSQSASASTTAPAAAPAAPAAATK